MFNLSFPNDINRRYYNVEFAENCLNQRMENERIALIHFPKGITKEELDKVEEYIVDEMNEYEEDFDDLDEFDINIAIEDAIGTLEIEFEYPTVDYTVYL